MGVNYKCPIYTNGHEHRDHGSGWAYGTEKSGRGDGDIRFRYLIVI